MNEEDLPEVKLVREMSRVMQDALREKHPNASLDHAIIAGMDVSLTYLRGAVTVESGQPLSALDALMRLRIVLDKMIEAEQRRKASLPS